MNISEKIRNKTLHFAYTLNLLCNVIFYHLVIWNIGNYNKVDLNFSHKDIKIQY